MQEDSYNIIHAACVYPEKTERQYIKVRKGMITEIGEDTVSLPPEAGIPTIDASGETVLPGMIDTHVHVRGGEFGFREDFFSASRAAASAGVTTILEMPGCAKPATTLENYLRRVKEVREHGAITFGLYGGAGYDNIFEIPKLYNAGCIGFKTFQMAPVKGREREFYGMCAENEEQLVSVMTAVKKTGLTLTVHSESQAIIDREIPEAKKKYGSTLQAFIESRPPEAELASVKLVVAAAKKTGCRTVIAHVSTPEAIDLIEDARKDGVSIYAESCLHYLYFDKEQMEKLGAFGRMKPPFRDRDRVDRLQQKLADRKISFIGSDHAPYTEEEKLVGGGDIWSSVDGLCGLELSLPLLLNLADEGKISINDISWLFSQHAAEVFRLRGKGRIEEGNDADLVFLKKTDAYPFDRQKLFTKCRDTARCYEGVSFSWKVDRTLSLGRVVFEDGQPQMQEGSGSLVNWKRQ